MRTQTEVEADLDRLRAALGTGERKVEYNGNMREFRSARELIAAIARLEQELEGVTGTPKRVLSRRFRTRAGW